MSPADTQAAVNSEVRFSQLDDRCAAHWPDRGDHLQSREMKRRLDTLASDIDQRLSAVEHGPAAGGVAAAAPAAGAVDPRALAAAPPKGAAPTGRAGEPVGRARPNRRRPGRAAPPARAAAAAAPASGRRRAVNYAFGLLRQANYPAAEQSCAPSCSATE